MTAPDKIQTELSQVTREEIERQTAGLASETDSLLVSDEKSAEEAKVLEKKCVALEKLIETERTKLTKPLGDFASSINAAAKRLMAPIAETKEKIRNKQIKYAQELEAERLRKENEVLALIAEANSQPDELELEMFAFRVTHPDFRIRAAIEAKRAAFEESARQARVWAELQAETKRLAAIAEERGREASENERKLSEERQRLRNAEDELKRRQEDAKFREAETSAAFQEQQSRKQSESQKVK